MNAKNWSLVTLGFYEIYWVLQLHKELLAKGASGVKRQYIFTALDSIRIVSFFLLLYFLLFFPQTIKANTYDSNHYRWCFVSRLPTENNRTTSNVRPPYDVSDNACNAVFAAQESFQRKLDIAVYGRYISTALYITSCGIVMILLIPLFRSIDKITGYKGPWGPWVYPMAIALAPPGVGPIILDKIIPGKL